MFVNGRDYRGMEDNDLRGYLDGGYKYRWNQPGQVHVRLGRRLNRPVQGEYELFRVIHRWADIELPHGSQVTDAKLQIFVEGGPPGDIDVFLYEVRKDFDPGRGGVKENNTSEPKQGEVWWGERAADLEPWGLPGVSFASEMDPDADIGVLPLARARYSPGVATLDFSSAALARTVTDRAVRGEPILFLLKLADAQEDVPGSTVLLYSGNHGDFRSSWLKPRLTLQWQGPPATAERRREILLEHGRTYELPMLVTAGGPFAVSFDAREGCESPIIEMRNATSEKGDWSRISGIMKSSWPTTLLRLRAVADPVPLGSPFESGLKNT